MLVKKIGPGFRVDMSMEEMINEIKEIIANNCGEFYLGYSEELPEIVYTRFEQRDDYTFLDWFYTDGNTMWIEAGRFEGYIRYKHYLEDASFVIKCHVSKNENNVIVTVTIEVFGPKRFLDEIKRK
jgi:hypothetical protein